MNFHFTGKVGGGILLIVKTEFVKFKWTIIYELHGPVYNYHYVVNKIRNIEEFRFPMKYAKRIFLSVSQGSIS